jgi:hypothetical protein
MRLGQGVKGISDSYHSSGGKTTTTTAKTHLILG